jgi:heterodisulfide reductase subunit B
MKYAYYPGCSLSKMSKAYDESTKAIIDAFDITLEEVEDWNCCGASEYFSINKTAAYALVARNLAIASKQDGFDTLVAPCSACYVNLKKTDHYMKKYPEVEKSTNESLGAGGLSYKPGALKVRHLLDILVNDVTPEQMSEKVSQPLTGLRVAPYYGCLIVRPGFDGSAFDDPEYPTSLDHLLDRLGATVIDFPLKAHCCGGHMPQISSDTAFEMIRRLLHNASEYDADVIATVCPMCQLNLDAYQSQVNRHFDTNYNIPILYFTQLIGLAQGILPRELGIGSEITSASRKLQKIGEAIESEPIPARRKKEDKSLPMPGMRREE